MSVPPPRGPTTRTPGRDLGRAARGGGAGTDLTRRAGDWYNSLPVAHAFVGWLMRRETLWGLSVVFVLAVLYAMTMCRVVYWYDSAEFAAHAAILGVPHPPGYPLYTMIAYAFTWLPGEAALDVNLMSAVFGVGAALLVYGLVRRLGGGPAAATVGATTLATSITFWTNAVVAEVYTPGLVFTLGLFLLLERGDARRDPRWVVLAALGGGLGLGMHMSIATCGLGYAWLVWTHGIDMQRWSDLRRVVTQGWNTRIKLLGASAAAAVLGACVFIYIPLRTFETWSRLEWVVFRKNATGGAFKRKFLEDYDWSERADFTVEIFVNNLQWVGIAVALVGAVLVSWRRPKWGIALLLAAGGNVYWFFNYNVPDLDVFYLPAIAIGCVWLGMAVDAAMRWTAKARPRLADLGWVAMALPVYFVHRNYETVDLSQVTDAQEYAEEVCALAESPSRIILYSSPEEWRYFAVFLYVKQALGQCDGIEIWKKPPLRDVHQAVKRGASLYMFLDLPRMGGRFEVTPEGRLFRLRKRNASRGPKRGKKARGAAKTGPAAKTGAAPDAGP